MSQQITTFVVTAGDAEGEGELNSFLRGHRILQIDRTYANGGWQVCVVWQAATSVEERKVKGPPVDYRDVLEPETFAVFARLREVRKAIAQEERLPAFAVFTNEQLAEIARRGCDSREKMAEIEGIGESRLRKYAERMLAVMGKHEKQPDTH